MKDLRWHLEEDLPETPVRGDENKLRQVLINLLGNAVKFTEEGEVVLKVQRQDPERYRFEVADTGPGIAPERQRAIFELFQQESEGIRQGGTGLGLAIARRHVELMGGELALESRAGEGTRFSFTLPLPPGHGQPPAEEHDWSQVRRLAAGQTVRALIVDDVVANRDILAQMLDRIGIGPDPQIVARLRKLDQRLDFYRANVLRIFRTLGISEIDASPAWPRPTPCPTRSRRQPNPGRSASWDAISCSSCWPASWS